MMRCCCKRISGLCTVGGACAVSPVSAFSFEVRSFSPTVALNCHGVSYAGTTLYVTHDNTSCHLQLPKQSFSPQQASLKPHSPATFDSSECKLNPKP